MVTACVLQLRSGDILEALITPALRRARRVSARCCGGGGPRTRSGRSCSASRSSSPCRSSATASPPRTRASRLRPLPSGDRGGRRGADLRLVRARRRPAAAAVPGREAPVAALAAGAVGRPRRWLRWRRSAPLFGVRQRRVGRARGGSRTRWRSAARPGTRSRRSPSSAAWPSRSLVLAALASVVVRFRRARGVERQQLKWFVFTIGAAARWASPPRRSARRSAGSRSATSAGRCSSAR